MKIGLVASAFDLLHVGHLALLAEAKNHCDKLVVALHVDPSLERTAKNKPIETVLERYLRLKSCLYIDEIIPYETEVDLFNLLAILKPDVRFLGSDYEGKGFTGDALPIKVIYIKRDHNYSSSDLRKRILGH
jgi:glycerol-3-phosphate cytidylyltransferase